ncbi:MAG TPA: lipopolysaccharide transport periplasmic protein LptA [Casimicrobiaceae bacterium]|nr:lipopolysaccharide transport periplasmic protein LptA [Casimicrobiaceae bacterium]
MSRSASVASRVAAMLALVALLHGNAQAEKADRDKPIHFSADQPAEVDFQKRVGTLKGNVIITQGTMTIHADRIDFKQNADNSLSATAWGNPVTFRQKKDDSDEYFEGYAQRAAYNGETQTLELFDRALLKQGTDEIRSNYVSYNSATGIFKAEGRPDQPGVEGPGSRVRGVFQPRSETPLLGTPPGGAPSGKEAPKGNPKEPAAKGTDKGKAPAKDAPLTLTPDASLSRK